MSRWPAKGAGDLPPIFLSQLCHLILRNALEGCDDPLYVARGGAVLSQPTGGRSRRHAAAGRCGGDRGGAACPARPAFIAAHGHAATAKVLRRDGRDGRRKRLDLLVAIGRARDGDESRRQCQGARRAVPGHRAVDWPSARRCRQRRNHRLDRGSRLALVRRPRQRGDADRQCAVARRARWRAALPSASWP